MPKSCCVSYCTNNTSKNTDKKLYNLPTDPAKRKAWLKAINRAKTASEGKVIPGALWSPKSNWCYVCSDHFISGERSLATNHPDYVPSVFPSSSNNVKSIYLKTSNRSPHRQILERNKRRIAYQGRKVAKKLILRSPDFGLKQSSSCYSDVLTVNDLPELDEELKEISNTEFTGLDEELNNKTNNISPELIIPEESNNDSYDIYQEINNLRKERDQALEEIVTIKNKLNSAGLRYESARESEDNSLLYILWLITKCVDEFSQIFIIKPNQR